MDKFTHEKAIDAIIENLPKEDSEKIIQENYDKDYLKMIWESESNEYDFAERMLGIYMVDMEILESEEDDE